MLDPLNRQTAAPASNAPSIRDTLFGDMPMESWPSASVKPDGEPWVSFAKARQLVATGRRDDAVALWSEITEMPDLESRHYLQAWRFLRQAGVQAPAEKAKVMLGVVIEVPMEGGVDLLAAYPGYTARYYNYTGAGVVWECPNTKLNPAIDALLEAASVILRTIGPWERERPPAPREGNLRINVLSPAGLHFGEGPFDVLASDPLAKPTFDAATILMQQLIAQDKGRGSR